MSTPLGGQEPEAAAPATPASSGVTRRRLVVTAGSAALVGGALAAGGTAMLTRSPAAASSPAASPPSLPTLSYTETGIGVPALSSIANDASAQFRTVAEALGQVMQKSPCPGAALGILHDGREEYAYYGIESMNTHVPTGPDTLFQLGSLTKTFTATAIWRLIDQGKLRVDGRVREYLPDLRLADEATAAAITVGQLLDHTCGFYASDGSYVGENDAAIATYVKDILPTLPQTAPLGQFPSYSNDSFVLLGRIIEVVTGSLYATALENLLLAPLGLTDTLLDRATAISRRHVDGHYLGPINGDAIRLAVQTPLFVPRSVVPAGGLWSTVRNVLAYGRFHLTQGREGTGSGTVSAESLAQMQAPVKQWPGLDMSIGRNWFVQEAGGVRVFTHNGDTAGCHAVLLGVPSAQVVIALLVNVSGGFAEEKTVLDAVSATFSGLGPLTGTLGTTEALLALDKPAPVTLPATDLAEYAGRYQDPGQSMTVTSGGPQGAPLALATQTMERPEVFHPEIGGPPAPAAALAFVAKDQGLANGVERVSFVRNADGKVGWIARGLRLTPHVQ